MEEDKKPVTAPELYSVCEVHTDEMMEKNISCVTCNKLICALCMRDCHLTHDIISVIKLRDCISLRKKVADDLYNLQVLQSRIQSQIEERTAVRQKVEASCQDLCTKINSAFTQLHAVVEEKKNETVNCVTAFTNKNVDVLQKDLEVLEKKFTNSMLMIEKVVSCTTQPQHHIRELSDLPQQLKDMVVQSQALDTIENEAALLAENKFSNIISSLSAVTNICKTLNPEATKVVWNKAKPAKKDSSRGGEGSKRKSNSGENSAKKAKHSSPNKQNQLREEQTTHPGKSASLDSLSNTCRSPPLGSLDSGLARGDLNTPEEELFLDEKTYAPDNILLDFKQENLDQCTVAKDSADPGNMELASI